MICVFTLQFKKYQLIDTVERGKLWKQTNKNGPQTRAALCLGAKKRGDKSGKSYKVKSQREQYVWTVCMLQEEEHVSQRGYELNLSHFGNSHQFHMNFCISFHRPITCIFHKNVSPHRSQLNMERSTTTKSHLKKFNNHPYN